MSLKKDWYIEKDCQYPVFTTEIHDDGKLIVIVKVLDKSIKDLKISTQDKTKEFKRFETDSKNYNCYWEINEYITEICASYYAGLIVEWFINNT
jgi:hypothetical protein